MEMKYEITMYKLLIIVIIGLFVAVIMGSWFGAKIGYSSALEEITVNVPEYCHVNKAGSSITISCTELEDITAEDFCNVLSPTLSKKVRILVTG